MKTLSNVIRIISKIALILCGIAFFLPYFESYGKTATGFDIIRIGNEFDSAFSSVGGQFNSATTIYVVIFLVPVLLNILEGILLPKKNVVLCVFCMIFAIAAFVMTFSVANMAREAGTAQYGLIYNYIVSIIGLIVPIPVVVLYRIGEAREPVNPSSEEV